MPEQLSAEQIAQLREKEYNATVSRMRRVHEKLIVFNVRPDFPLPSYRAGQYTTIGLGYWEPRAGHCQAEEVSSEKWTKLAKRVYSISSPLVGRDGTILPPEEDDFLEFYITLVRQAGSRIPALTPRLFALDEGSRLFVGEKITGSYTLTPVEPENTVLFMATGTGEAPHNAMLLELLRRSHPSPIASVVCVRYQQDLAYLDAHRRIEAQFRNYTYITMTTREGHNRTEKLYIQDLIRTRRLEELLGRPLDPASAHAFLCGNPKMIGVPQKRKDGQYRYPTPTGVVELLEQQGFRIDRPREPGNIHFERYW